MGKGLLLFGAAIASAAGVALAGCGEDGEAGELAAAVPPDVPIYAEAVIRPEGDQREAIESLVEEVGGIDDPGARLIEELDRSIADEPGDFTYADDIEPWLGERGAFFVRSFERDGMDPDAAAMVQVTDTEAAQEFLDAVADSEPDQVGEEQSYRGVDYRTSSDDDFVIGLVGELMVGGTEASFKVAVDASGGESLAESEEYTLRREPLDDDPLATVYLEPAAAIEAAINAGDVDGEHARLAQPLLGGALSDPVVMDLTASDEAATLEAAATFEDFQVPAIDGSLIEQLPGGSWLAAGGSDIGPALERWLDQLTNSGIPGGDKLESRIRAATGLDLRRDVLRWLGDVAIFVRGTEIPGVAAGLVAEISDPQGPRKLVDTVQALAEQDSGLRSAAPPEGADYGFALGAAGIGAGADVGVADDRLIAAFATSFQQVLAPDESLAEDDRFQGAVERLSEDFAPVLFVDIPQAFAIGELSDDADSPDYEAAKQYAEKLGALVGGIRVDGDLVVSRLILSLAE